MPTSSDALEPMSARPRVAVFRAAATAALTSCVMGLASSAALAQGATRATSGNASSLRSVASLGDLVEARTQALARANAAVVGIEVEAIADARSIASLGRQRQGSGVVIGPDGLVLTIGYLILEAEHVDLLVGANRALPARVVAYDLVTGFGLVQALAPLDLPAAPLAANAEPALDEPLMIASGGANGDLSLARVVSRRAFSGYWEYHLDAALFTAPARRDHSGAALFNADGELLGIGSLLVADALGPGEPALAGNVFVPVEALKPILGELRERGRTAASQRPWLGLNCTEANGAVRVVRVAADSPADHAGLVAGDQIVQIDAAPVTGLESFYKALWQDLTPERDVVLQVRRASGAAEPVVVHTRDRMSTVRRAHDI